MFIRIRQIHWLSLTTYKNDEIDIPSCWGRFALFVLQLEPKTMCFKFMTITRTTAEGKNIRHPNLPTWNSQPLLVFTLFRHRAFTFKSRVFFITLREKQSSISSCACNNYFFCALFHFHGWQILIFVRLLRGQILWLRRGRRVWRTAQLRCCCLLGVCFSKRAQRRVCFLRSNEILYFKDISHAFSAYQT